MAKRLCVVCNIYTESAFIKFPENAQKRLEWITAIGISPTVLQNNSQPRICLLHFDDDQWEERMTKANKTYKALKKDAVPNINVGETAPAIINDCSIPRSTGKKNVRCAVCNVLVVTSQAVAIYDKNDLYTDFGTALAFILTMSSRVLSSRYCCVDCSEEIFACFGNIVNFNVYTMLTTRMNERHHMEFERLRLASENDVVPGDVTVHTIKDIKTSGVLKDEEICLQCKTCVSTLSDFADHVSNHFFEQKDVYHKTVVGTQTDEMEIDMGAVWSDDDNVVVPSRSKPKKRKTASLSMGIEEFMVKYEDVKVEALEPEEEPIDEEALTVETLDNSDEEGNPISVSGDEIIEEHLISEDEMEEGEELPEEEEEGEEEEEHRPRKRKMVRLYNGTCMCHVCGRTLKNASSLKNHIKMHMGQKKLIPLADSEPRECEMCGKHLKHLASYKQHVQRVHSNVSTAKECDICGQVRGNLTQHKKTCQAALERGKTPSSSTCVICGKTFASRYMTKHLKMHTIEDDIAKNGLGAVDKYVTTCTVCNKRTQNLTLHMKKEHRFSDDVDTSILDVNDTTNHDCMHCGAHFEQRPLLVNHLVLKHGFDPKTIPRKGRQGLRTKWTCSVCQQDFHTYGKIKAHTQTYHNGVGIDLSCETCGKRYNTIEALREHINVKHINYYEFNCFPCDKHFVNQETYRKHLTYFCRLNGFGRKGRRKDDVPTESTEMDTLAENYEEEQLQLVDISGVAVEGGGEEGDVTEGVEAVYLPEDNMVVVYEEVEESY